jgi:twitching motility two-component system response regulator PilH
MDRFSFGRIFGRKNQIKERRSQPRKSPPSGTTILLVDDSKTVLFSLKKMLEQNGYKVVTAENGEQAIVKAKDNLPDLIFMDVIMPGMNGFRATRTLSRDPDTAGIPIVIMSGDEQSMQQFWVSHIGASDFLTKPFNRGTLFEKVEQNLNLVQVA